MIEMILQTSLGGSLRFVEAIASSGPTLLVGLFIAAVFRYYLGIEGTRRLFGGDSLRALPQSWAVGMLLPVCSIGVLPILLEMRRSRIKPGALTAFALSAPLFNPLSLLYGLTLSRPYVILMFALSSLAVVTIVGLAWDKIARQSVSDKDGESFNVIGVRRLLATVAYMCRQLCGPAGAWTLVAAAGMMLLATALPWGSLQHGVNRDDWMAPARMTAVSVPAYATPMMIMSQLGMMFQHANSPGAAFVLLVLGAGLNLATVVWLVRQFGFRSVTIWFACLLVVVVGIAYAINKPLFPPGVDPSGHTHAFDYYSNPIHHLDSSIGDFAKEKLKEKVGPVEQVTLCILGVTVLLGLIFRIFGIKFESESKRKSIDGESEAGRFDRIVSEQTVGATMLAGLVAVSIVMCYAYYPSPEECLEEVKLMRADVLTGMTSGRTEHAMFFIPRWDEWSRRLEVGTFLRRGRVTPYQRMQGYLIRKKLEVLEHELAHEHDDPEMMRELFDDIVATNSRWVRAFRGLPVQSPDTIGMPSIAIDPNVDSQHLHQHSHGDGHSHDHDHNGFAGSHEHDHVHKHQHDDAPHDGRIVNLNHNHHEENANNLHLEVMPIRDGVIEIYPLKELIGKLRPLEAAGATLELRLVLRRGAEEESFDVILQWDEDRNSFRGSIPSKHLSANKFEVDATFTVNNESPIQTSFPLVVEGSTQHDASK